MLERFFKILEEFWADAPGIAADGYDCDEEGGDSDLDPPAPPAPPAVAPRAVVEPESQAPIVLDPESPPSRPEAATEMVVVEKEGGKGREVHSKISEKCVPMPPAFNAASVSYLTAAQREEIQCRMAAIRQPTFSSNCLGVETRKRTWILIPILKAIYPIPSPPLGSLPAGSAWLNPKKL